MKPLCIILLILLVLIVLLLLVGFATMCYVIYPKRPSYEKAEHIEKSKGFWGEYDSYPKEVWNIDSRDYTLHGVLLKNDSNKYVIITHGYMYNRMGSIKYANIFYKLGYNVYLYDLRHFGQNKKVFCSMGRYEPGDIIAIQEALYDRFGENITIGLHGESLGCASSILALGLSQRFSFVIADCGFYDLNILLRDLSGTMLHLPAFVLRITDFWMWLLHRYKLSEIRPVEALATNDVPILFVHGKEDDFILPKHALMGYDACHSKKKLYLIEKARHAQSYEVDPQGYADMIKRFLDEIN